jgi:signal transduction histidine kinase
MPGVRGFSLGVLMVLAVATVLAFAARSLSKERARLLQGFADAQQATANDLSKSLEDRLLDTEEDTRVIATLVQAAHRAPPGTGDLAATNMIASFNAMAIVVRHYRSLALFDRTGTLKVSAVDPTEAKTTGDALLRASSSQAKGAKVSTRIEGPIEVVPGRFVYLYSFAADEDVVVITIDAPRFLQSALRAIPDAKVVVLDPGGTEWGGCVPGQTCSPQPRALTGTFLSESSPPESSRWLDVSAARAFGLPAAAAVAAWAEVGTIAVGQWRVVLIASASALHERAQALLRNLVLTVLGLLVAFGVVGALIVRQQRYAAALSERLRNSETLRSLEGQLVRAEKLATTGVLAAGIAHEVGTPLGIIRARAELLLDELGEHTGRHALDAIVQQIDRISSTIRQVLDFSRSQAVEVQRVSPATALNTVTELLEHRFRQQRLRVTTLVRPDTPDIAADPNQLQQVLVNLLLNACDACPGGGAINVSVSPGEEAMTVEWNIRDNGAGIAQEHLLAVFDPFFTTKKRGEGTGLGLSVVTGIVRNHRGEITLASAVGEGTTVTLRWPAFREGTHAEG